MTNSNDDQIWNIGTYCGNGSICVNLDWRGTRYHRHDYSGILPRWMRVGWYIRSIERESGLNKYDHSKSGRLESAINVLNVSICVAVLLIAVVIGAIIDRAAVNSKLDALVVKMQRDFK